MSTLFEREMKKLGLPDSQDEEGETSLPSSSKSNHAVYLDTFPELAEKFDNRNDHLKQLSKLEKLLEAIASQNSF